MVIAALVCFIALVVAWIVAPDGPASAQDAAPIIEPELAAAGV
jgi:hypothetical protein